MDQRPHCALQGRYRFKTMRTTQEGRDALRKMAGTVAVKGSLLIELLDDIEQLRGALESLWPGLVLDLRYADADDDKDAMRSRIETVREAIGLSG